MSAGTLPPQPLACRTPARLRGDAHARGAGPGRLLRPEGRGLVAVKFRGAWPGSR